MFLKKKLGEKFEILFFDKTNFLLEKKIFFGKKNLKKNLNVIFLLKFF